jgi:hypothetical protein
VAMVHEIEGDGEGEDAEEQEEVIVSSELDGQQKAVDKETNRLQRPEVRESEREVKREERRERRAHINVDKNCRNKKSDAAEMTQRALNEVCLFRSPSLWLSRLIKIPAMTEE